MPAMEDDWVWRNGEWTKWKDAKIHISTHAFLYGTAVFEGIRAYWDDEAKKLRVWMLREHCDRLCRNVKMLGLEKAPTSREWQNVIVELLSKNKYTQDVYIRPVVYLGAKTVRVRVDDMTADALVFGFALNDYFAKEGLRCAVSSWVRPPANVLPPNGKVNGAYANSFLASNEAKRAGYDEAIMLNTRGLVSEGPAENLFLLIDGALVTPPVSSDILDGVTRAHIASIAADLDVAFKEREVGRTELYAADEMFFCGTGVEIEPILEVDDRPVGNGKVGPVTTKIREAFRANVRGKNPDYVGNLTEI